MKTAKQSRAESESSASSKMTAALRTISVHIDKAVEQGAFSCTISPSISTPGVALRLEELGYTVKSDFDCRGGDSWTTVSW